MLTLGQAVRLRATWSQGFKTPTPKELHYRYIRQMSGIYLYLGNENLKPQTSNYFSMGGEYTWNGLSITATAYYNKVKDMITDPPVSECGRRQNLWSGFDGPLFMALVFRRYGLQLS